MVGFGLLVQRQVDDLDQAPEFQARLRIDPPGKRPTSETAASGSMCYEACSTDCSRQQRDVLSMTVVEIHLEEPQVDDADA